MLDGPASNTARSLRSCTTQMRAATDIVIPNYCFSTFEQIRDAGLGTAYYGSLRAYIDSLFFRPRSTADSSSFGLVYLDYCSRLTAGFASVEKSPIADIGALFRYHCFGVPGRGRSLLAICFCREQQAEQEHGGAADVTVQADEEEEEVLVRVVTQAAVAAGYSAGLCRCDSKNYELMMMRIFEIE